jgi:autotransporter-associated beta strand protein
MAAGFIFGRGTVGAKRIANIGNPIGNHIGNNGEGGLFPSGPRRHAIVPATRLRRRQAQLLSMAAMGCLGVLGRQAVAANDLWLGNTDATFGTAANWTAGTTPVSGDSLEFGVAGSSGFILSDNLMAPATYNVSGITFDSGGAAWNISAGTAGTNGFTLAGNITDNNASKTQIINDLITLSGNPTATVVSGGSLSVKSIMSGSGAFTVAGGGIVTLSNLNTYTGGTTVSGSGTVLDLTYTSDQSNGVVRGPLTIGSGAQVNALTVDDLGYTAGVSVSTVNINGGTFNNAFNGNNGFVTSWNLTAGTVTSTGGGAININGAAYGVTTNASSTTSNWTAPISLRATGVYFNVAQGTTTNGIDLNIGGVISNLTAGFGITKNGAGTMALTKASTYTGVTVVNAGTLELNFNGAGAPATNILFNTSSAQLYGGTLNVVGSSASTAQTVGGVTFEPGLSNVIVSGSATLSMGAMTPVVGGAVMFTGPATATYSGGNGVTPTPVAATGTIKTTTAGGGPLGLVENTTSYNTLGAYATVGLYDWATTDVTAGTAGTSPYTIIGGSQVTGFYSSAFGTNNTDVPAAGIALPNATSYGYTLRFNTPAATAQTPTVVSNPYNINAQIQGILITPNMGPQNAGLSGSGWTDAYSTTGNATDALQIWQNNTQGYFNFAASFGNGRANSPEINGLVQNGLGTVVFSGVNTETGKTWLNGGYTVIGADSGFGAPATAAAVLLNGGTIVGASLNSSGGISSTGASFALDNAGANARPITILSNGGGLAATAGSTLTIDGQIGSATNGGTLVIGIPASAANGNVAGLLPGSGTGTANTTPVYGTGTVSLTYANGTAGNFQYSPTLITGGATLEINSQYDLGGADAGSLTFNGGTLQYNPTLATGTAGTVTDVSIHPVNLVGNATVDTYGHNITFANPIGGGGSGGLTVVDSTVAVSARGSLTLSGANSFTGPTIVNSGTLALASGASLATSGVTANNGGIFQPRGISSAPAALVTVNSGGTLSLVDGVSTSVFTAAGLTLNTGSSLSYELSGSSNSDLVNVTGSGGLIINGAKFNLYAAGGTLPVSTDGTYTLISYTGADTVAGGGTIAQNTAALAADLSVSNSVVGLNYTFADTGSAIVLTIGGTPPVSAGWSFDGSGSWAVGSNWTSSPVFPNSQGSTASFAGAAATHNNLNRTVTLDQNETVGTLMFASPNGESYTINQGSGSFSIIMDNASAIAVLTVTSGIHTINAPISLNSSVDVTVASGGSITLAGTISNGSNGSQTITKDGLGTLALSGANTYGPAAGTVGTTIDAGTVGIGNNLAFSTGDVSVTASATLQSVAAAPVVANNLLLATSSTLTVDTQTNNLTFSGVISGSSALAKIGLGTLILSNTDTYTGATTITAGTLQLGSGAVGGSVAGNIADNATLALNRSDDYSLGNLISGSGNLTQNGPDNVTLTAANTFTGYTAVAGGTLVLGNSLAIQNSTLNYNNQGGTISFGSLTAATFGGLTGSQNLALANTTTAAVALTFQGTATSIYTGFLNGSGSVIKTGAGSVTLGSGTLGGANYSGSTTVNQGTLVIGGYSNLSGGTVDVTGYSGVGSLIVQDNAIINSTSALLLDSDDAIAGGTTQNANPGATTMLVKNNAGVSVASFSFGNVSRVASSSLTIQDNASMTVNGTFDVENSEGSTASTNQVYLNGGTLAVTNFTYGAYSNGTNQLAAINFNGGVLKALASDSTALFVPAISQLTLDVDAGGAIVNTNGFNDTIALPLVHGTGTTDGGVIKTGSGILTLSGSDTYKGVTNVSAGVLVLSQTASLPSGSVVSVSPGAALVDTQNAVLTRAGSLNINGSLIIQNSPSLQSVTQAAASGYTGGTWSGTGAGVIGSSLAAADTSFLHAVAVIQNDNGAGTQLYTTFEGYSSLNDSDVLVKYTWYGDTDLNGEVDGTDYSRIDYAYAQNLANPNTPLTGWFNGDFNYDGVIDGSDYTLMDNAFNQQGAAISAQIGSPTAQIATAQIGGGSAVPEPASLGLLGIGAVGLLGRRNRRRCK